MKKRRLVLIVHNVRSAHNVGSILRSADGFDVSRVYLTGYTPYPLEPTDTRLPHVAKRATHLISKTALGAEEKIKWEHQADVFELVSKLKQKGWLIVALEQTPHSVSLVSFKSADDIALIVGSEVGGIEPDLLKVTDVQVEIPMKGLKESFNVSVATAVALYHLLYVTLRLDKAPKFRHNHKLDDRQNKKGR